VRQSSELARAQALAGRSGLAWIDLDAEPIDPTASDVLPIEVMAEALAVPYAFDGNVLKVALADPSGRATVEQAAGRGVDFVVASRASVANVIGSLRQTRKNGVSLVAVERFGEGLGGGDGNETALIRRAAEAGASDLHFVPCELGLSVRARIDGALRQIGHIDASIAPSTTIHAALSDLANPTLNVVTVEDPVEYRVDGIYQLEVNPHADVTFESALRSLLRSDPDVVGVGEMRDLVTAATTLKAALTGSFVLSTLHTRDAPSAITRLLDMGVEPYVTAATVTAVIAQRLVRRLCVHCRERYQPTPGEATLLEEHGDELLFRATGCDRCDRGYRGQIGVHQLMLLDEELRRLVLRRASYEEVCEAAAAGGMRTLWDDGLEKAVAGLTSVDELRSALADVD
jgi:hypothetical protein